VLVVNNSILFVLPNWDRKSIHDTPTDVRIMYHGVLERRITFIL